ncbi:MAG TPA: hypothetical protein DD381_05155 [Lentisphaeria bacterium]|nr:MAG: hypothetical protein A2X47_06260 [Lentisphaerae bacterium GWF2_38_69]HBM15719.1 hypothetical protein [Lentisphaeria bacterium]
MENQVPIEVKSLGTLYDSGISSVSAAIGVFDGIHLGHRAIISKLLEVSSENNSVPIVITFYPHPRELIGIEHNIRFLRSPEDKLKTLGSLGVKAVVTIHFTKEIASMSPEQFIGHLTDKSLCKLKAVCVGRRWRFGSGALGTVHVLMDIAAKKGFEVFPVNEVHLECGRVSSSAVRKALAENNISLARRMLSDPAYGF